MKKKLPLKVISSANTIIIVGQDIQADFHSHHAIQISISLEGDFALEWKEKQGGTNPSTESLGNFEGVMIDADIQHRLDGKGNPQAVILIDPEFIFTKNLKEKCSRQNSVSILPPPIISALRRIFRSTASNRSKLKAIYQELFFNSTSDQKTDSRINSAIEHLKLRTFKTVSSKELASLVHLSESRLSHLFKLQIGIPLRRYLLWLRLIDALKIAKKGHTLTEAAHRSGFSDAAHFSRTFQSMFGISPSVVVKYSEFIQVSD